MRGAAKSVATSSSAPHPRFEVTGNRDAWERACEWVRLRCTPGASRSGAPPVCVLRGPCGTGKTSGAEKLAAAASYPLIELTPTDVVDPDDVERTLTEACTRASMSGSPANLVLVDDLEAFTPPCCQRICKVLHSLRDVCTGVIVTTSSSFRVPDLLKDATLAQTIWLHPLSVQELIGLVRARDPSIATGDATRVAMSARGDARQALLMSSIGHASESDARAKDTFDAAKQLLFSKEMDVSRAESVYDAWPALLMNGLMHANYVNAGSAGMANALDAVQEAAEQISCADVMRTSLGFPISHSNTLWSTLVAQRGVKSNITSKQKLLMPTATTRNRDRANQFPDFEAEHRVWHEASRLGFCGHDE